MIFDKQNKVTEALGHKVVNYGIYLGRSQMQKDCYWACHKLDGQYYISLNTDFRDVYEADEEDIADYCEVKP